MGKVPTSVDEWLKGLSRREPLELGSVDKKLIRDFLANPQVLEVWRQAVELIEAQSTRLGTLNTLDPADAAEALRIQGQRRALVTLAEHFLEAANAGS